MTSSINSRLTACAALAVALAMAGAASAETIMLTSKRAALHAGPATRDRIVTRVVPGQMVTVHGCLSDYSWCDTEWGGHRGWARSSYLTRPGMMSPFADTAHGLGIPEVGYDRDAYEAAHHVVHAEPATARPGTTDYAQAASADRHDMQVLTGGTAEGGYLLGGSMSEPGASGAAQIEHDTSSPPDSPATEVTHALVSVETGTVLAEGAVVSRRRDPTPAQTEARTVKREFGLPAGFGR